MTLPLSWLPDGFSPQGMDLGIYRLCERMSSIRWSKDPTALLVGTFGPALHRTVSHLGTRFERPEAVP